MTLEQKFAINYEKLLAFVKSVANEMPSDPADGPTTSGFPEEADRLIKEITLGIRTEDYACDFCGEQVKSGDFHQC